MVLGAPTTHWVYVTGTPRSGTTFVGKILSTPLAVDYVHEPFNPDCGLPGFDTEYLYLRPGVEGEPERRVAIANMKAYAFRLRTGYFRRDSLAKKLTKRVIGSRGPFYLRLAKANVFRRATVVKDPKGCLLTEYLAKEFAFRPLVLIRHPAAYVASQMRLGPDMETELNSLANQPAVLADYFDGRPDTLRPVSSDPVAVGATLWRVLNIALLAQARAAGAYPPVRHEDVSAEPLAQFRALFAAYDLPWTSHVERRIARLTGGGNASEARWGRTQDFRRDSAALLEHRLRTLTAAQRRLVHDITADVAAPFYPKESFLL